MVVSFVNAGLLSLTQSITVIMGANVGTTVTADYLHFRIQSQHKSFCPSSHRIIYPIYFFRQ